MNVPNHSVRIDIATCPSCTRMITAEAAVRVKVEQPKPKPLDGVRHRPDHMQPAKPASITVTATPIIVGLYIDHCCGEVARVEETR